MENKAFIGKHRLNVLRCPAEVILAAGNPIGEGGENAVSDAILRLYLDRRHISVNEVFARVSLGKTRPPAKQRRALISDFGGETFAG